MRLIINRNQVGSISPATKTITSDGGSITLSHIDAVAGITSRQWQVNNGSGWTNIPWASTGTTCITGTLTNNGTQDITYK